MASQVQPASHWPGMRVLICVVGRRLERVAGQRGQMIQFLKMIKIVWTSKEVGLLSRRVTAERAPPAVLG